MATEQKIEKKEEEKEIAKVVEHKETEKKHRLLTEEQKINIILLKLQGKSYRQIAKITGVSSSLAQTIFAKWSKYKTIQNRWNPNGRPRLFDKKQEEMIIQAIEKNRTLTCIEIANDPSLNPNGAHSSTINRILLKHGFRGTRAPRNIILTDSNKSQRKNWAIKHQNWAEKEWGNVIFSDESNLFARKFGINLVRKKRGEKLDEKYHIPREVDHDGLELMVYGNISANKVGKLVKIKNKMTAVDYIEILENHISFTGIQTGDLIYQHDNAPIHKAQIVQEWLDKRRWKVLSWPARSPDLNPIENIWAFMKDGLWKARKEIHDVDDLWANAERIWYSDYISNLIVKLYASMPNRVAGVVEGSGARINY